MFADLWWILSAEHGLVHPDEELESYDTSIEDVDQWLADVSDDITSALDDRDGELWVLVGQSHLDAEDMDGYSLRRTLNRQEKVTVRYPFSQTEGIGEQQRWLNNVVESDRPQMPYAILDDGQQSLNRYGDDAAQD